MSLIPPNLARSKRSLRGPGRSPKAQLAGLCFLLIGVASLFAWLRSDATPRNEALPIRGSNAPIESANAPPAAVIDQARLRAVQDATQAERIVCEPLPFQHLLQEAGRLVAGDFRRLEATVADDAVYQQIDDHPADWRGKAIVAKARFNFVTAELLQTLSFWRGVATDDLGRAWSFSVLEEPEGIAAGDVIKIEGFFFKRLALFDPTPTDPRQPSEVIDPTLHLVGERVVKSFLRMPPVKDLSSALLATVRDDSIAERLTLPEEPLWHVLSFVQNCDANALAAAAAFDPEQNIERDLESKRLDTPLVQYLTSQALAKDPDQHRGAAVRLLGSVSEQQKPWFHDEENPLELPRVWHSLLVHQGPSFTYLLSVEKPPEWVSGQATVLVEGVFFKLYTYEAVNRETVTCPVVVVKRFVPFHLDVSKLHSSLAWIVCAIGAPVIIALLVLALRDRKENALLRERQLARRRTQRQAGG